MFKLVTVAIREDGCFSVLLHDGQPFAVTCEHVFDGKPVIPAGTVSCSRTMYHKGGYETFEIPVEGHERVLFHRGNTQADSKGCVLVAENFAILGGVTSIGDSKGGFEEFMQRAGEATEIELEVVGR